MSGKTKIVVLHMKEVIYTAVFAGLGLILIILLVYMFFPGEKGETKETAKYMAGVYTSSMELSGSNVQVQVAVDENRIQSISFVNLDETVETMYPLMEPALEDMETQILQKQSLDNISYKESEQYTSMILLNAIGDAIEKAKIVTVEDEL